jgi:hypothetical protein
VTKSDQELDDPDVVGGEAQDVADFPKLADAGAASAAMAEREVACKSLVTRGNPRIQQSACQDFFRAL